MAKKQNKDETNHCFLLSCIVGLEVTAIASLGLLTYALYSMSTTSALAVAAFTLTASTLSTLLPFLAVGFLAVAFILGGLSCCRNDEVSYSIGIWAIATVMGIIMVTEIRTVMAKRTIMDIFSREIPMDTVVSKNN